MDRSVHNNSIRCRTVPACREFPEVEEVPVERADPVVVDTVLVHRSNNRTCRTLQQSNSRLSTVEAPSTGRLSLNFRPRCRQGRHKCLPTPRCPHVR